ncbi:MAG: protein kinase, partial [Ilumatobacteraceae bacterium]
MASNDALIGRALAGRYRLVQRRGTGAHGIVLDAVDEQLQRPVAVKIMLPQFVSNQSQEARFRLEAQVAGSMTHPNLNAVFDWGVEEVEGTTVPYLVLEHLSGGSLRDMLDRGRLLTPSQALMVGLDACRGLDYMHRRGVIHRDLKPANLAFGDDRHVRILDVGISRMVAEQTWREPTAAGIDAARYASPEQARGGNQADGTLDSSTDIYSLCLVMIEAVTGHVPFSSDSTVATLNARLDKLVPVSADFGPLASVLSRAGNPNASDRYDAAEFGRALVMAAEKLPRPGVLPIVTSDSTGGMRRPTDPTGPVQRPEPTAANPIVPPVPVPDAPTVAMVAVDDSSGHRDPTSAAVPTTSVPAAAVSAAASQATQDSASGTPSAPGTSLAPAAEPMVPTGSDAPRTEKIDVLAAAPKIDIVLANADVDGHPHFTPPPPPTGMIPAIAPTPDAPVAVEPPEPTAFPAQGDADVGNDFSITMATEPRPTQSMPSVQSGAARTAA